MAAAVLGPWLVITLPICLLYLIGKAPVISGEPLWNSAETRSLERELRARPALSDGGFYHQFYERSGLPIEVVSRIRHKLRRNIDPISDRAIPGDSLATLWDDLDFADLLSLMGREFDVKFTKDDYPRIDGTLDNLIRVVHERVLEHPRET